MKISKFSVGANGGNWSQLSELLSYGEPLIFLATTTGGPIMSAFFIS
jgi:hypothetical protein